MLTIRVAPNTYEVILAKSIKHEDGMKVHWVYVEESKDGYLYKRRPWVNGDIQIATKKGEDRITIGSIKSPAPQASTSDAASPRP